MESTRFVDGTEWTLSRKTSTVGSYSFRIWINANDTDVLCDHCTQTCTRERDLKRHYERFHVPQTAPSDAIGPIRRGRPTHRQSLGHLPAGQASTSHSRIASLTNSPRISSPLVQEAFPPHSASSSFVAADADDFDAALGHLTIESPTKESQAIAEEAGFQQVANLTTESPTKEVQAIAKYRDTHLEEGSEEEDDHKSIATQGAQEVQWTITVPEYFQPYGLAVIEDLQAILCIECRRCIPWNQIAGHLKEQHKRSGVNTKSVTTFASKQNLCRSSADIIDEVKQTRQFLSCPWLAQETGWWCEVCAYATTSERMAAEHTSNPEHDYPAVAVMVDGNRHFRRQAVIAGKVQTLYTVKLGGLIPSLEGTPSDALPSASKVFRHIIAMEKELFEPPIIAQDDPRTVHPFIKLSGFQRWLGAMTWREVETLQARMRTSKEWGPRLRQHCVTMMEHSFSFCTPQNYMACCHINSPTTVTETTAFGEIVSTSAQTRYSSTWAALITYLINNVDCPEAECRFGLSAKQAAQLAVYLPFLQQDSNDDSKAIEALTFLSASLFCHEFGKDTTSGHPLIAFTILSSVKAGNIIADPVHISPFLASIEYFCRTTIMVFSHIIHLSDPSQVSFYDAAKKLSKWLKEGENTAFAWIRQMLHLCARFIYANNQMPRFVRGIEEGKSYTFDGYRIEVSDIIQMVRGSVEEAVERFFSLWKSYGLPEELMVTSLDDIGDALSVRSRNYNFARHPANVGIPMRSVECQDAIIDSGRFCRAIGKELVWYANTINQVLEESQAFLISLAAALYLGSGQPPRGTELMATLITNIDTRVRNVFVVNGTVRLSHFLNKTTFILKSDKAVVRETCHSISLILFNYIAFVRPNETKLAKQVGIPHGDLERMQQQLFAIGQSTLTTATLTSRLKTQWKKYVLFGSASGASAVRTPVDGR
ncbi:hypothetical protein FRB90_003354 [Tulasnella sp. 427]|nr:hypothetical protein FRB90_003354 [Tulasnella sp. 427]